MADLFASLEWADGQINPSGIKTIVYYALKSWIKTFPRIVSTPAPTTAAENVNVAGDFEMVAGKTFKKLYSTQGKGKLDWEPLGEKDHKMFLNKGMFSFPDIGVDARSMVKQSINSNIVMIVPLPHESENRFVMLGDYDYDVEVSIKGTTGDKPGSEKGLTFEISAPSTTPLPGYAGSLVLETGTLDCETGVFTETGGTTVTAAISGVGSAPSEVDIAVVTTGPWAAESDQVWCTVSPSTGTGNDTIVASIEANLGAARTCIITVTPSAGSFALVSITQAAAGS